MRLIPILFLIISINAFAQSNDTVKTKTLIGVVIDNRRHEPVPCASILINSDSAIIADINGLFKIKFNLNSTLNLKIMQVGYYKCEITDYKPTSDTLKVILIQPEIDDFGTIIIDKHKN
jgi:hypothetical protein